MVKRCVAAGCYNINSHNVLRERCMGKEVRRVANDRVTLCTDGINTPSNFIDDHFETETVLASHFRLARRQRLKPDAVPTLFTRQPSLLKGAFASTIRPSKRTSTEAAALRVGLQLSDLGSYQISRMWLQVVGSESLSMYSRHIGISLGCEALIIPCLIIF